MSQTLPCSLIANEVVTNTIKHAFDNRSHGTIDIDLTQHDNQIRLRISDDGNGLPDNFENQNMSLGMNLINTLSEQMGAEHSFTSSEDGTTFTIQFAKQ